MNEVPSCETSQLSKPIEIFNIHNTCQHELCHVSQCVCICKINYIYLYFHVNLILYTETFTKLTLKTFQSTQ